ncbi:nuclear transport factor 2 family protein [Sphingomonas sp.]|uniref:nuclear transport factor 2 family protein n=1 Tax=Sphingomonas sp. TaxID=28214 RepID=UPI0025E8BD85|nr:nuclear transport factor 2 family protein [Sphingomonas sp.]
MADILTLIETLENRWMRAWIGGDAKTLKSLTSRNFRLVVGSKPSVLLDYKSWIDAAAERFPCRAYRFGEIYVRNLGSVTIFATQLEIEASIDGHDWSGRMWVTDLWKKGGVRRSWRMVERVMSRPEDDKDVPAAIRSLQLWRRPKR